LFVASPESVLQQSF